MEQYIKKSALVAEIEKCYNECLKRAKITDPDYWNAKADAYRNVLAILDDILEVKEVGSMQKELKKCMYTNEHYTDEDRKVLCEDCEEECKYSKKEEPVSEDLERAADNCYFHNHAYARESFIEGAKWQKAKDAHLIWQISSANYEKGKQEGKEQIMENAIKCEITWMDGFTLNYTQEQQDDLLEKIGVKVGDKVKLVIIKEE